MKDRHFEIEDVLKFSLFQGLESHTAALELLMAVMKYETFQARDSIIDEKATDDRLFLLHSGEVEVNKVNEAGKVIPIGRTSSWSHPFFGESALLGKPKRSSNVVARTVCNCISLRAKDFETFMKRYPEVGVSVYRNMASLMFDRLWKADCDLMIIASS